MRNTLTSSELQTPNIVEDESSGESESQCFMVQGNDSLEVYSESQLDCDDASSSSNEYVDSNTLNEELSVVCEKLLEKYNLLKKKTFALNRENENLSSRLDLVLQEKEEMSSECDSLKSQLNLALKENEILKNRNNCNDILKKNKVISSKLDFVVKKFFSSKTKLF